MKSEPETFSIDDLRRAPGGGEPWSGVRNYQARNFMRDEMKAGDRVLFYHSNCPEPGVVGLAKVVGRPYPDPTAFDPASEYFDPKSDRDKPRWILVNIAFVRKFPRTVTLAEMRAEPALADMLVLRRGNRLSITPVEKEDYDRIVAMALAPA